jgi:hypothetical protein
MLLIIRRRKDKKKRYKGTTVQWHNGAKVLRRDGATVIGVSCRLKRLLRRHADTCLLAMTLVISILFINHYIYVYGHCEEYNDEAILFPSQRVT